MRPTRSDGSDDRTLEDAETLDGEGGDERESEGLVEVDPSHYEVAPELARGGMGVVRRARDRRARREVVIKELLITTPRSRARFEREAWITARLQHPSIVPVYEVGQWPDGRPFYAMKHVGGRPLDQVVEEALDDDARLALIPRIVPAVEAIAYAHEQGVIHRDLKPANVLLGEFGETIVIDWGVARSLDQPDELEPPDTLADEAPPELDDVSSQLTRDGDVVGTPAYMPPEQARGLPVDARADVYALGALLYHALAGVPPHDAPTLRALLIEVALEEPVPLAERAPSAPRDLVSIVEKAMARDKEARYADAGELARDLEAFSRGRLVGAYTYTSWELLTRFVRRNRALSAAIVAALVITLVGAAAVVRANGVSERERERAVAAEQVAVGQERAAHARLSQVYWRAAVRRLQYGDHLGAEVLAAAALREQPANPASPYAVLSRGDALSPADRAARLAGLSATWSAANALRFASLGRELNEHADWVYDLLPSPDGQWIVTVGADRRALVWDAAEGRVHRTLEGHEGTVFQAALSPNASELVTSGYDGTVRQWSFPDGELVRVIDHPSDRVYGVCYAGTRLLAAGHDVFAVYDAETGEIESQLDVGESIPWMLRCFGDSGLAVLSTTGAEVVVMTLDPPGVLRAIPHPGSTVQCATLSRDERTLITADKQGMLRRFEPRTGELLEEAATGEECEAMAVSPDGRWIALGSDGITIVDAASFRPVARLDGHDDDVVGLEFDATGRRLYSGSIDRRVIEWRLPAEPRALTLMAATVTSIDSLRSSADGRRLVSASDDGSVAVWDLASGRRVRTIQAHTAPIRGLGLVGETRAVTASMDRTLVVHDLETGRSQAPVELSHFGEEIATTAGSTRIALGIGDGDVLLYDVATGARTRLEEVHEGRSWWTGFDATGRRLASASFAGTVAVIDPDAGRVVRTWEAHDDRIYAAGWRPGTDELTTADTHGRVRAWNAETGAMLREWVVLDGEPIHSLAWSADGERLLLTTREGMRVHRPDGALVARVDLGGRTTAAAWTPDERAVFASAGRIFVLPLDDESWRADPDALLGAAQRAAGATVNELIGMGPDTEP